MSVVGPDVRQEWEGRRVSERTALSSEVKYLRPLEYLLNNTPAELEDRVRLSVCDANAYAKTYPEAFPPWAFYEEAAMARCQLLREVARRVVDCGLPVALSRKERERLLDLVSFPCAWHGLAEDGKGFRAVSWETNPFNTSGLMPAARDLWKVLAGEVRLLRCPAPAPGHSNPTMKCGRYFVSGGKVGRPAQFCSDACTKRDSRVRKKVAERQGVRGN